MRHYSATSGLGDIRLEEKMFVVKVENAAKKSLGSLLLRKQTKQVNSN